jgi:hypothetical protein
VYDETWLGSAEDKNVKEWLESLLKPNWNLSPSVGTCLNASPAEKMVVDARLFPFSDAPYQTATGAAKCVQGAGHDSNAPARIINAAACADPETTDTGLSRNGVAQGVTATFSAAGSGVTEGVTAVAGSGIVSAALAGVGIAQCHGACAGERCDDRQLAMGITNTSTSTLAVIAGIASWFEPTLFAVSIGVSIAGSVTSLVQGQNMCGLCSFCNMSEQQLLELKNLINAVRRAKRDKETLENDENAKLDHYENCVAASLCTWESGE